MVYLEYGIMARRSGLNIYLKYKGIKLRCLKMIILVNNVETSMVVYPAAYDIFEEVKPK